MDSEMGCLELSFLYMERRFNIYSVMCRYVQLFEDILKSSYIEWNGVPYIIIWNLIQ